MLVVDISINRETPVSSIGAIRISPENDIVDNDTICTYRIGRVYKGKIPRPFGTIKHRYGDGAEALAATIVSKMKDAELSTIEEDNFERLLSIAKKIHDIDTGE